MRKAAVNRRTPKIVRWKKQRPGRGRDVEGKTKCEIESHWLGSIRRVQPVVLMSRNNGVRGGNKAGVRKLVSKL
jgi:hypothetical protein